MEINRNLVLIILIVLVGVYLMSCNEGFSADTTTFVPVGAQRYGLRGEPLQASPFEKVFIPTPHHIRINHTGGLMYKSRVSPTVEGIEGCAKVACPIDSPEFQGNMCWQCDDGCPDPTPIPAIHSHGR